MTKATYWLLCATAIALAGGCATQSASSWSSIGQTNRTAQLGGYSFELPQGWMQTGSPEGDRQILSLSRDGVNLQVIEIVRAKPDLAFPNIKRGAPSGALPSELAELQIANIQGTQGLGGLTVVKNEPLAVAGTTGFQLHVRFKNGRGLQYERIVAGFAGAESYYTLAYQAPTLHYFDRDRATFDAVLRSIRASGQKPG